MNPRGKRLSSLNARVVMNLMDPGLMHADPLPVLMGSATFQTYTAAASAEDPAHRLQMQGQQINPDNTQLGYWTEAEVAELKVAVESLCPPNGQPDSVDWLKVAAMVPTRSAKQCRQKWLNHLRDGISKDPWSLQEEYVLARMHSKIGNKWQVLAKYLPRRPENTVKNHWSATTRAKGAARMRTLLWLYADLVVHKNNPHSPEVFNKACMAYNQIRGVPPISAFAVAEDHFISGPGKGLAGLDSGMAAPMGISSRAPTDARDPRQRGGSRGGDFDEGDYMGEDAGMGGGAPAVGGDFTDFGAAAFPMFAGIDPNLLHPDLASAWLQAPGMANFNFNQLGRQFQLPSFPNQMLMPSLPGSEGWQVPNGGQYEGGEEQDEYEGSEPGGESQDGGRERGRDRRRPQRYREEEDGAGAHRASRLADGGSVGDEAANMLLALANAANSILDDDGGSGAAPSRKRPHSEVSNQRRTSGGGGANPQATPPTALQQPFPHQVPLEDPEKQMLARLAQEAAANLVQQPGGAGQDQLWQQLEQRLARPPSALNKSEDLMAMPSLNLNLKGLSEGGEERRVRATNSSSVATDEPLRDGTTGAPRVSSNGEGAYPNPNEEGEGRREGATKSPTSCTRGENDAHDATNGARSTPPLSSSAAAPPNATPSMEDCVVVTLGKLATDPTLSAQERVQLIGSYMKAVQSFVKITVDQ